MVQLHLISPYHKHSRKPSTYSIYTGCRNPLMITFLLHIRLPSLPSLDHILLPNPALLSFVLPTSFLSPRQHASLLKADEIWAPTAALFFMRQMLMSRDAPPVNSWMRFSRKGVTADPRTPPRAASCSAAWIALSTLAADSACSAGTGTPAVRHAPACV